MQELFVALPAILKQNSESSEVRQAVVFAAWRKVAGEQLCEHATPLSIDAGRLTIAVADRSWKRNLEALSGEMIYRLNLLLASPVVTFIEFKIEKSAAFSSRNHDEERARFQSEALDQITDALRSSSDVISDDAMRRKFLLAAGSCLAREKRMKTAE